MIFLVTDTHFNHVKMLTEKWRPGGYEEKLFSSMEALRPNDILIHLGDISVGRDGYAHSQYIEPLRCTKILVKGNHDHQTDKWYLSHGWEMVCDDARMYYKGLSILFTHRPEFYKSGYDMNIHGHLHNDGHRIDAFAAEHLTAKHRLLAMEFEDYKVVSLDDFIERT